MNKREWLDAAEVFDSCRIVPRVFFIGFSIFAGYVTLIFLWWYFHLPAVERGYEESGSMTFIIGTIWKFWVDIFKTYSANGRDWNQQPGSSSSTTTTVQTSGPTQ